MDDEPIPPPQRMTDDTTTVVSNSRDLHADSNAAVSLLGQLPSRINRRELLKLAGAATTTVLAGCTQSNTGAGASDTNGTIDVTPADSLIDERLETTLSDFGPNEEITVWTDTTNSLGETWLAFGRFKTNSNGKLALDEQAPNAGTYEAADPMGLLWSMRVAGGPDASFNEGTGYTVRFSVQRNDATVASTTIRRRCIDPDVVEHRVDENGLVGIFFEPPRAGPHPAVLALHGTEGKVPWLLGAMLASHGYATLALQYFDPTGKEELPPSLVEIPLEYFERAIDWVFDRPSVAGDHVGVIGPSIGGELTLLLGATLSRIGVVVGYVPSGLVWQGPGGERPMWTYEGEPVPFVPFEVNRDSVSSLGKAATAGVRGRPIRVAELFQPSLDDLDTKSVEAATIPVEEIDGPVLLISGKDDGIWPSTALSEIAMQRLEKHDHPYPYKHLAYENAGHIISVPTQPTTYWDAFEVMPGVTLDAGGTAPGNAHAAADSWPHVLNVLAEGLR